MSELSLPVEHEDSLRRLKSYYPYRIVYGYFDESGEFCMRTTTTESAYTRTTRGLMRRGENLGPVWRL